MPNDLVRKLFYDEQPMKTVRIATRKSPLALYQSQLVAETLSKHYPQLRTELVAMTTAGDRLLEAPLSAYGGKSIFIKELEQSLWDKTSDIAVHSMKDVPADLPDGFVIAAMMARANPADALVCTQYEHLSALPQGATLGTSSLRRQCQIQALRKDLVIKPLRGNVGTRMQKLHDGQYDALVLASAGLERLQMEGYTPIPLDSCLPAIGQGAIGIECRSEDPELIDLLQVLNDLETASCVNAERAVSRRLGADCRMPLAAYAHLDGAAMTLQAVIGDMDDGRLLRATQTAAPEQATALGETVADLLTAQGADTIIQKLSANA